MSKEILLGKSVPASTSYDPNILFPILRTENRTEYEITNYDFRGYDVWNAYEISFLTDAGLPVFGVVKMIYPSNSEYIIESKSLKLYFNSFNMTSLGASVAESIESFIGIATVDLSEAIGEHVTLTFFSAEDALPLFDRDFDTITEIEGLEFDQVNEAPELLQFDSSNDGKVMNIRMPVLRSNCKVTHQPDWGVLYLTIRSQQGLDIGAFMKYLVSFRNESHFHEEVCEMIYKRLLCKYSPEELMVCCMYSRRGGIDICPIRANNLDLISAALIDPSRRVHKELCQ